MSCHAAPSRFCFVLVLLVDCVLKELRYLSQLRTSQPVGEMSKQSTERGTRPRLVRFSSVPNTFPAFTVQAKKMPSHWVIAIYHLERDHAASHKKRDASRRRRQDGRVYRFTVILVELRRVCRLGRGGGPLTVT